MLGRNLTRLKHQRDGQADLDGDSGNEARTSDLSPKEGERADLGRGQEGGSRHRTKQSGI